jgi:uncharacterized membrane protein YfcA
MMGFALIIALALIGTVGGFLAGLLGFARGVLTSRSIVLGAGRYRHRLLNFDQWGIMLVRANRRQP